MKPVALSAQNSLARSSASAGANLACLDASSHRGRECVETCPQPVWGVVLVEWLLHEHSRDRGAGSLIACS